MKVYFTYSKRLSTEVEQLILQKLEELGLNTVLRNQATTGDKTYNFDEAKHTFQTNVKNLRNADIVIAECSYASSGLGYEISLAVEEKKPFIALYNLKTDLDHPRHIKRVPIALKGNNSRYIMPKEYEISSLKKTLELSLKDAKELTDTKFILIIPPMIDRYLEWNSKERGKSKAEVTREAIEKVISTDAKYQDYLSGNDLSE